MDGVARPRSEDARRRVLAATAELVAERGVAQLTIEEVAARSGVAKTTIYRHWPGRTTLILDVVNAHFEHIGTPDTGSPPRRPRSVLLRRRPAPTSTATTPA